MGPNLKRFWWADKFAKQGSVKPQPPKPVSLKTTKNIIKQEYKQMVSRDDKKEGV